MAAIGTNTTGVDFHPDDCGWKEAEQANLPLPPHHHLCVPVSARSSVTQASPGPGSADWEPGHTGGGGRVLAF